MEAQQNIYANPPTWLAQHQESGTTTREALEFFDSLAPVTLDEMTGRWKGSELRTGHRMDGLLTVFGWYGKEFLSPDNVHPLLFTNSAGEVIRVDSRHLPIGMMTKTGLEKNRLMQRLFSISLSLFRTQKPRARLRMMEHRGKVSATMIYDFQPIHDTFRRVDQDTLLGLMDLRGEPTPFFFVLRRDTSR